MDRRLRSLCAALCVSAAAHASEDFHAIADRVGEVSHDTSCAAMEQWLVEHPGSDEAPHALLWMARLRLLDGRDDLARPLLERAGPLARTGAWHYPVLKELASLDAGERRYALALEELAELEASGDEYWRAIGSNARGEVRAARLAWWTMAGLLAVLGGVCAARLAWARRRSSKLWPPPFEVMAALPVIAVLGLAAAVRPGPEGRCVLELLGGGVVLLWVSGVALQDRSLTWPRRAAELLLGAAQLAGLFFCVLVANGLLSKAIDTLIIDLVQ
jgi:hypothetical protein